MENCWLNTVLNTVGVDCQVLHKGRQQYFFCTRPLVFGQSLLSLPCTPSHLPSLRYNRFLKITRVRVGRKVRWTKAILWTDRKYVDDISM